MPYRDLKKLSAYRHRRRLRLKARGMCMDCGTRPIRPNRANCEKCATRKNAMDSRHQRRLKIEVLTAYGGPICKCCGETTIEFLSIEHSKGNGDGEKSRKLIGSGTPLYRWLKKTGFPKNLGLEVLCMNCQFGRKHCKGRCPHQGIVA